MKPQVALVTGAAHRVGKAIALALAGRGLDIVVHYHRAEEEARRTVEEIQALGVAALPVQADLSTPDEAERLFDQSLDRFGQLDVLVNSAAIMERMELLSMTVADWDRVVNVNLRGPFLCTVLAGRQMMKQERGGVIVNIGDVSGLEPWAKYPAHSVSKAGLFMLTQVAAKALAPKVRVNAIASGPVLKAQGWEDARWNVAVQHTALKRAGTLDNMAQAVLFLIENDFATGAVIVMDGGEHLQ